jgi:Flp pilus assembly protein TadG
MMFTLLTPFVLLPVVGLAIDGTLVFSVKSKLQAALDGAALAGAESLSSGLTFAAQSTTAVKTADQFIKANFVAGASAGHGGYWGSYGLNDQTCDATGSPTPSGSNACIVAAQDVNNKRTTVTISAAVNVPLIFMRLLGFSSSTVTASAQAARRDVVMVLVLDRSSSMDPTIPALQAGATLFVNGFQSTRDRLGLVVFGGSAIVAYPPGDWNNANPTGPDTNFMTANPNMIDLIDDIADASNTGTADALMLAYKELQAANQPGALNVIVLFTDGQPNGITANFNNSTGTTAMKAGSTCTYKPTDLGNAAHSMIGWMAQWGGYASGNTNTHGVYALMQNSTYQNSVPNWLANGNEPVLGNGAGQPANGCAYGGTPPPDNSGNVATDVTIPSVDYYGNSTTGSINAPYTALDYQQSEIWGNECNNGQRTALNLAKSNDSCQIGLASWNAADMAGKKIHSDTTLNPVIYCMGYEGNGGDDPALMRRLANINIASNTVYDSTKPSGKYIQIQNLTDISGAFASLAEEILRLSM